MENENIIERNIVAGDIDCKFCGEKIKMYETVKGYKVAVNSQPEFRIVNEKGWLNKGFRLHKDTCVNLEKS